MTPVNFRDALSGRDGTQPFTWALPVERVFRDPTLPLPDRAERRQVRVPEVRGVGERRVIDAPRGAVVAEVRRVPPRPVAPSAPSTRPVAPPRPGPDASRVSLGPVAAAPRSVSAAQGSSGQPALFAAPPSPMSSTGSPATAFLQMPVDPRFAIQQHPVAASLAVAATPTQPLIQDRPTAAARAKSAVATGRQWQARARSSRNSRKSGSLAQTIIALIVLLIFLIGGGISVITSIIDAFLR